MNTIILLSMVESVSYFINMNSRVIPNNTNLCNYVCIIFRYFTALDPSFEIIFQVLIEYVNE